MRPLAVLALILGALASLFFAFVMISASSRGSAEGTRVTRGPLVRPNRDLPEELETGRLQLVPVSATPLTPIIEPSISRDQVSGSGSGAHIGFIRGLVVDPDGNAVKDARIDLIRLADGALWSGGGLSLTGDPAAAVPLAQTVSAQDGKFRFGNIEPGGNWGLSVKHNDFAPQVNGPIVVPDKGGKEELVQLEYGSLLSGLVLDAESRAPIADAELMLVNPMSAFLPSTRKQTGEESARTDVEGRFRFKNVSGAQRTLVITAAGYATQVLANFSGANGALGAWTIHASDEQAEAQKGSRTILMLAGNTISGMVLAPDRSGVGGVQVTAQNNLGEVGSRAETSSDSDGSFTLKDLGPGAFTISSVAEKFQSNILQRVEAGSRDVVIQLIEYGSVAGSVTDAATGEPLTRFTCRVRSEHPSNPSWGVVAKSANFRDRDDGSFDLSGIREGRYVVEVISQGYASSFSQPFRISQGIETPNIDIGVTKGSVIRGIVTDAAGGAPLAGAKVTTNDNNFIDNEFMKFLGGMGSSATSKKEVITDAQGNFTLDLLTPDTYQLRVWKAGYSTIVMNDVDMRAGNEKTLAPIRLPRGAMVNGTVYDEEGATVAGASVIMSPEDVSLYSDQLQIRTDANGNFSFKNVRQGTYKLQSTRPQRPGANPFAGAVDMQNSVIQVEVIEGQDHLFDVRFRNSQKPDRSNF